MKPFLITIAAALLGPMYAAYADAPERFAGKISVGAVSARAGNARGSSRLELKIRNDSRTTYRFLGVTSPAASGSNIMGRVDETRTTALDSTVVLPNETLEFDTSHLWITLESLRQPLLSGEQFPVTLRFAKGSITVTAHVHP
jgi:copper(I)-binding protein